MFQLDKFNTFRGKEKKDRRYVDRHTYGHPGDYGGHDSAAAGHVEKMSDAEVLEKFEKMLVGTVYNFLGSFLPVV